MGERLGQPWLTTLTKIQGIAVKVLHSYARFSHMTQATGDSQRRQADITKAFIAKHPGYQLSALMIDKGRSAFKGNKQKALQAFLAKIDSGEVKAGDTLLVEAIDRLTRKGIRDTQDVVNKILDAGIDIAIASPIEKIYKANDKNDFAGTVELAAFSYAAHIYSKLLSDRVKQWHEQAREQAQKTKKVIHSGLPPAWLKRTKRMEGKKAIYSYETIPERVEAIKYIFERTIAGDGMRVLGKLMNKHHKPMGKTKVWNETYIRAILNDRRVLGECQQYEIIDDKRTPTGEPIADYYPRIIEETPFLEAQTSIAGRRKEKGPTTEFINLFTGIVWHAVDKCGCQIYQTRQTRADGTVKIARSLKSTNAKEGVQGASTATVHLGHFEQHVLRNLRELDLSVFNGKKSSAKELIAANQELKAHTANFNRLQLKAADSDSNLDLLMPAMRKVKEAIDQARKKVDSIKVDQTDSGLVGLDTINNLKNLDNTPENRQMLRGAIKKCVERIDILPVKTGTKKSDPVGCLIEITLVNGVRREIMMLGTGSMAYTDEAPTTKGIWEQDYLTLQKRAKGVLDWLTSDF